MHNRTADTERSQTRESLQDDVVGGAAPFVPRREDCEESRRKRELGASRKLRLRMELPGSAELKDADLAAAIRESFSKRDDQIS